MKGTIDKYTLVNKLLHDEYAIIQINPQKNGVILPDHLMQQSIVSLKLSKLFSGGMEVTKEKIEANLSFNRQYFLCIIPMEAIVSVTSVKNEVTIWPEGLAEVVSKQSGEDSAVPSTATQTEKKKPRLKRIK